ncbi:hypothetical protein Acsp06_26000 [Actinomycetospora sp. NBRC 106375]|uniref:hypothetical protein n=1 Tax=Actinomycetospora sp. NBRC 106375 TaxID=3032207 RepID=UPI0024A5637B|nr:hypothetical protein [Actinomycetospora sp. NBRC 106375]GLZ46415.1 hypothetical protein Acsp06_26000 [Actinomycetospora sp. NBRC 106375]
MSITSNRFARLSAAVLVTGGVMLAAAGTASATAYSDPGDSWADSGTQSTSITFSGAQSGTLADASTSCIGGGFWEVTGTLDGTPVDMYVAFSQGDPGEGSFPMDTGLDPEHGLATVTVGDQNYVTDSGGENTGTFTVDPGGTSGSLDIRTSTTGDESVTHVQGTWSCA